MHAYFCISVYKSIIHSSYYIERFVISDIFKRIFRSRIIEYYMNCRSGKMNAVYITIIILTKVTTVSWTTPTFK